MAAHSHRMEPFHERGHVWIGRGLDPLRKCGSVSAVQLLREFPDAFERRPIDRKFKLFDLPFLEAHVVPTLPAIGIAGRVIYFYFVKTRWQCGDIGQAVEDGPVFQLCHGSGNKNSEVPDMGIDEIDDPLAGPLQVLRVLVDDGNPPHRLVRRGNVVALRGEDDNRIADTTQIGKTPGTDAKGTLLQPIADEQVSNDGKDLFTAEKVEATPPAFEPKKTLALAINMREQVRVFLPDRFRSQSLEILHQPCAVEPAISEIGYQVRRPGSTEQATGDAHRVHAGITSPVGQRRSVQHNRAGETLAIRGKQRDRPSRLAVSVKNWR